MKPFLDGGKGALRYIILWHEVSMVFLFKLLGGLITYLLLAIYCHNEYKEKVSIKRVRELRTKIRDEAAMMDKADCVTDDVTYEEEDGLHAKT